MALTAIEVSTEFTMMKLRQVGNALLLLAVATTSLVDGADVVVNVNIATTGPTTYTGEMSDW